MFVFCAKGDDGSKGLEYLFKVEITADQSIKQRVLEAHRQQMLMVHQSNEVDMFDIGHILAGEDTILPPGNLNIPWPWWESQALEKDGEQKVLPEDMTSSENTYKRLEGHKTRRVVTRSYRNQEQIS